MPFCVSTCSTVARASRSARIRSTSSLATPGASLTPPRRVVASARQDKRRARHRNCRGRDATSPSRSRPPEAVPRGAGAGPTSRRRWRYRCARHDKARRGWPCLAAAITAYQSSASSAQAISASSTASSAAAPVAVPLDQGGGLIATGAGSRDAALGEQNAGAQQIRIRQEQRHRPASGDGFGLAKRFDSGARIAAAPQRFGMGEKAAQQYDLPIGVAQSGERFRGALGAISRRWRPETGRPPAPRGLGSTCLDAMSRPPIGPLARSWP